MIFNRVVVYLCLILTCLIYTCESQQQVCMNIPEPPPSPTAGSTTAGPPGKKGPVGPSGPRGPKGDKGECSSEVSEVESLKAQLKEVTKSLSQLQKSVHCPLGMEYGFIKASQITASSENSAGGHGPDRARLNSRNTDLDNDLRYDAGDKIGGWHSDPNVEPASGAWIQVDLLKKTKITGVITQGRGTGDQSNQWLKSFQVLFKNEDSDWNHVTDESGQVVTFTGNTDRYGKVANFFPNPLHARYIRLSVVSFQSWPVFRFELLGC